MRESSHPTVTLHRAESDFERSLVFRFRHRVLVGELGLEPFGVDHRNQEVRDGLDTNAQHITLMRDGAVVAAIRLIGGRTHPLPGEVDQAFKIEHFDDAFPRPALTLTDRLVLDRNLGQSEAALLLGAAYKIGRRVGSRFDFTHCAPALVRLYEQLGYRRYSEGFVDAETGYRVPMVLLTEDLGYLRNLRSPLTALAATHANPPETALWFARNFPDYAGMKAEPIHDEERFWAYLCERLHQPPTIGIRLFAGLKYSEVRRFLKICAILPLRRGATLVRAGSRSNEMFLLLSGTMEARMAGQALATFHRGDVVGEFAFLSEEPRSADLVATEETEVLVLTQDSFRRAMAALPEIAAKVLFNLSLVLCHRLKDASRNILAARASAA